MYRRPLLKLLSVVASTLLWFQVQGSRQEETTVQIPIRVGKPPTGLVVVRQDQDFVSVRVRGPRAKLRKFENFKLAPYAISLLGSRKGTQTFWIQNSLIKLPRGLNIESIQPHVIRVDLDDWVQKTVEVRPRKWGQIHPGFELMKLDTNPNHVQLSGARTFVDVIEAVDTDDIEMGSLHIQPPKVLKLKLPSVEVEMSTQTVALQVELKEVLGVKSVEDVPVSYENLPAEVKMQPTLVNVDIRAMGSVLAKIEREQIKIRVPQRIWDKETLSSQKEWELCQFVDVSLPETYTCVAKPIQMVRGQP